MQEVDGDAFKLSDSTGTARILTGSVPSGCPSPSSGEFLCLMYSLYNVSWFCLLSYFYFMSCQFQWLQTSCLHDYRPLVSIQLCCAATH